MLEEVIQPRQVRPVIFARTVFYRGWPPPRGGGAADRSMVIRCFGDNLAGFVHDDFDGVRPLIEGARRVDAPIKMGICSKVMHLTMARWAYG